MIARIRRPIIIRTTKGKAYIGSLRSSSHAKIVLSDVSELWVRGSSTGREAYDLICGLTGTDIVPEVAERLTVARRFDQREFSRDELKSATYGIPEWVVNHCSLQEPSPKEPIDVRDKVDT